MTVEIGPLRPHTTPSHIHTTPSPPRPHSSWIVITCIQVLWFLASLTRSTTSCFSHYTDTHPVVQRIYSKTQPTQLSTLWDSQFWWWTTLEWVWTFWRQGRFDDRDLVGGSTDHFFKRKYRDLTFRVLGGTRPSPDPPSVWEVSISTSFISLSFITLTPSDFLRSPPVSLTLSVYYYKWLSGIWSVSFSSCLLGSPYGICRFDRR